MKPPAGKLILFALATAVATPLAGFAQTTSLNAPHYNHRELVQLERSAHSTAQFASLAAWFRSQEKLYDQKALAEKTEWERRKAVTASPALKYPTGADSAHNLYDYYIAKSSEMAARASWYEQRLR